MFLRGSRYALFASSSAAALVVALSISGTPTLTAAEGVAYVSWSAQCFGGKPPYAYASVGAALPTGLSVHPDTGLFSGTLGAGTAGSYPGIIIRGVDDLGTQVFIATWTLEVATPADTTPDDFFFTAVNNADLSTAYESDVITVAGVNTPATVSVSGGTYSKNGGGYTSGAGTASNGDTFKVTRNSSGSFSTAVVVTLTIGGVARDFTITTAAVADWPYAFVNGAQVTGFGSSTMSATGGQTPPFTHALADSSATWTNKGVGGTNSGTILTAVNAATAPEKAGEVILQLGGNWLSIDNPEDTVLADALSMATALGHSRFLHAPKHNDASAPAGSKDWTRLRRLTRLLTAQYPGRVHDMALTFRHETPADADDTADQTNDMIPRSLDYDPAHANTAGNLVIGRRYGAFVEALRSGVPYLPEQRILSTDFTAAQTNGGLVCTVPYDAAVFGALTGVTVDFATAQTDFSVAIESGAIKIRRATATFLTEGSYDLPVRLAKAGKRRTSWQKVFLTTPTPGANKARINSNWLAKEGRLTGVTNTSKKFIAVFGLRFLSGSLATRRLFYTGNGSGVNIEVKTTNRTGFVMKNSGGTTVVNLDGGTGANLIAADADIRWIFMAVDTTSGVQIAKVATDANAAVTNVPTLDAVLNIDPISGAGLQKLFSSTDTGGSLCDVEVAAIWMAEDYSDIGPTTGKRDLFRDAATKASLIPADGIVDGITPFLFMAGPAGNWKAGMNLAQPTDRWDATDRNTFTTV